ncbi:MAG: tetratricopeptide repeat protein [Sphingomonadaceae bacterium]
MKMPTALSLLLLIAVPAVAQEAPLDPALDRKRYDGCVRSIESAAATAETYAREWAARGGGLPARHCLALAQLRQDKFAEAEATLVAAAGEAAAAKSPFAADFWGQAGNAALLAGRAEPAIAHFTAAIASAGEFAPRRLAAFHLDRARAEAELGRLSEARADLDRALELDREEPQAWMLSAALARRAGDLGQAVRDIERASTLAPSDPDIMFEQGNIAAANGDLESARRVWTMVTKAAPGTPAADLAARALADRP